MNSGENDFDSLEAGTGACPDAESLAGFAAGSLSAEEMARLRVHISACDLCERLVESLREFDQPVTGTTPGWSSAERRMRARAFPKPQRRLWLLHPAVAYGIALLVVIAAAILVRRPVAAPPVAATIAMESVATINLDVTRGSVAPNVTVDPEAKYVVLTFLIDIHPGWHYSASLDGGPDRDVVSGDGKGNFSVLVSRDLLKPGKHNLKVTEINPGSGKMERSFEFPFQF